MPAIIDTETPAATVTVKLPTHTLSLTVTPTQIDTLEPAKAMETIQPLIKDPMNCTVPCFWGIIPGKTIMGEARIFFSSLGFTPFEGMEPNLGKYFYTIDYESSMGRDSSVTLFYIDNSLVENIIVRPEITKQKEGSPREWIAFSPETLIKKYGKPSEVRFGLVWGPNLSNEITMIMYFDDDNFIVLYLGDNMVPDQPHSPQLCPLTAPFEHVRLWLGPNPPNPPLSINPGETTVPLEKAASLTIDQFTQLMLGDPQQACFTLNGDVFP